MSPAANSERRLIMYKTIAALLALCLATMPLVAREKMDLVPPGNWGAVEALEMGTSISIRMNSGDKIEGKFLGINAEAIRITYNKKERIYPRTGVAEVRQINIPDGKLNGTLYGMLGGAAIGIPLAAAGGAFSKGGDTAGKQIAGGFVLAGIGLGALMGFTMDAVTQGDRLLFRK
jgi:hypothetical protein